MKYWFSKENFDCVQTVLAVIKNHLFLFFLGFLDFLIFKGQ